MRGIETGTWTAFVRWDATAAAAAAPITHILHSLSAERLFLVGA